MLGTDPAGAPEALRARIGVMPQGGGAYPGGAGRGDAAAGRRAAPRDPLDPAWLVDVLGLRGCARTPYKRLSGGQQQRLALALRDRRAARAGVPRRADRRAGPAGPAAGVGAGATRCAATASPSLLTTHLMEEAEALADHVVIVDHGRVVAQGSPAELTARRRPGAAVPRPARAWTSRRCARRCPPVPRPRRRSAGRYVVRAGIEPARARRRSPRWCAAQGVLADDVQVARRSLEDVFLELTGRELRS